MDESERQTDDGERLARFSQELRDIYRIKRFRSPDVTQKWLAREVGRDQTTISNWLRGIREPSARDVFRLEAALGVFPGRLSQYLGFRPSEETFGFTAEPVETEDVISADLYLEDASRGLLLAMYRTARKQFADAMRRFNEHQDAQLREVDEEEAAG